MARPPGVSFGKDLGWRLEVAALDLMSALVRPLPVSWVSGVGGRLLRLLGPRTRYHRLAERNLRLAFPGMGDAERARLLREQWDNLGRSFFEFPLTDKLTPAHGRVEVDGMWRLEELARRGEAAVLISGHFANYEVMAAVIAASGLDCRVTYRAANNPYADQRIIATRARYGVKLFAPKGAEGSRDLLKSLQGGQSVSFMNDQKFNGGVAAPFFGRTVHTAGAPTRLALRFGGQLLPMSVQRLPKARFRVVVHEPIRLEETGDRERDLEAGVAKINAFMEARILERPAEWFWVHKRWPNEAYAELEALGL
jgi:Kdo2-lipid IVA lauroyltransferase/acyltransferase